MTNCKKCGRTLDTYIAFHKEYLERCDYVTNGYRQIFGAWSFRGFVNKIDEEVQELKDAKTNTQRRLELADIIMTCIATYSNTFVGNANSKDLNYHMNKTLKQTLRKVEARLTKYRRQERGDQR